MLPTARPSRRPTKPPLRGNLAVVIGGFLVWSACSASTKPHDVDQGRTEDSPASGSAASATDGTLEASSAAGESTKTANADRSGSMKTMQSQTPTKFKKGPAIAPTAEFVAYLDTLKKIDGSPLIVRLPVVLVMDPTGFGVGRATVGGLALDINDGALGIGLADRARPVCKESGGTCAFWLEGYFTSPDEFDVRKVGETIAADALSSVTHCDIEDL